MAEELKTTIKAVGHYKHCEGNYSIWLEFNNNSTGLSTHCYSTFPGCHSTFTASNMTPELMYELAGKIIDVANRIVSENNKPLEF